MSTCLRTILAHTLFGEDEAGNRIVDVLKI